MKRLFLFFVILLFSFNSIDLVVSVFCCQTTPGSGEYRCYNSGICCRKGKSDEYWDNVGCFDFNFWVEPSSMTFTIGKKTKVNLYIKNTGSYDDNYTIDYIIVGVNPALIQVDMSYVTPTGIVDSGTIKTLYPTITVLSSEVSGSIVFNATSQGKPTLYENTTLAVRGGLPLSLPEFDFLNTLWLIILAGVVYYFYESKH
jgi:hypothetical protein